MSTWRLPNSLHAARERRFLVLCLPHAFPPGVMKKVGKGGEGGKEGRKGGSKGGVSRRRQTEQGEGSRQQNKFKIHCEVVNHKRQSFVSPCRGSLCIGKREDICRFDSNHL